MELRFDKGARADEALAAGALKVALYRAERPSHAHDMASAGLTRWGLAFSGKRVVVACRRVEDARRLRQLERGRAIAVVHDRQCSLVLMGIGNVRRVSHPHGHSS